MPSLCRGQGEWQLCYTLVFILTGRGLPFLCIEGVNPESSTTTPPCRSLSHPHIVPTYDYAISTEVGGWDLPSSSPAFSTPPEG